MSTSNITLSPASRVFVDTRSTSLGPWVLGGFMDCILMGVIFCQVYTYFLLRRVDHGLSQYYTYLVVFVTFLSVTKTSQAIAVVWVQNVQEYGNPDVARTLVNVAWWQVSVAFMTGIIGTTVQSFFALRYYKLSRNWVFSIVICLAILLGLTGISLSMANIVTGNVKAKVMWLLVHFVSVAIGDLFITLGTCYTLRKRSTGLVSTASLINRTLRLVFESAIPPTVIAIIDLIMSQTLGPKLLWHLFVNYSLSKVYVISLLFTLNSIAEYRKDHSTLSQSTRRDGYSNRRTRHGDIELAPRAVGSSGILVQTEVTTDASPDSPIAIPDFRSAMDRSQKTRSHYQKKTYPRPESPEKSRFSKF
ncbi:hypothetical protein DFH08DRAFT_223794 [Mycena albidolilacea]|uniref:DUF6534 domain-containing protein n=1 Tax=Mycena albidolilacea TaxID=1033008 RepID=A0AAD6ZX91_9AGAR|nr:hypothetical protein DFH08DRAFT_223794 [Mycena albidolilacea]